MRRDHLELNVRTTDRDPPVLAVDYDGPDGLLSDRVAAATDGDEPSLDVTYREYDDESGVLAVASRVTGDLLFEAPLSGDVVETLVAAARTSAEEPAFELAVTDEATTRHQVETLLVYDAEGELRRDDSLIPGGVEL